MNQIDVLKLQILITQLLIQAEKAKEGDYSAPWLKNVKTIYRVSGRFASKNIEKINNAISSFVERNKSTDDFIKIKARLNEYNLRYVSDAATEIETKNIIKALNKEKDNLEIILKTQQEQYIDLLNKSRSLKNSLSDIEAEILLSKDQSRLNDLNENRNIIIHKIESIQESIMAKVQAFYTGYDQKRLIEKKIDNALIPSGKSIGYNPNKRFQELMDLSVDNSNPTAIANASWRIGILKAEAKYGKLLDNIIDSKKNAYEDLIDHLIKNKQLPVVNRLSVEERKIFASITGNSLIKVQDNLKLLEAG